MQERGSSKEKVSSAPSSEMSPYVNLGQGRGQEGEGLLGDSFLEEESR